MAMKRRDFLQHAALALTTLGVGESWMPLGGNAIAGSPDTEILGQPTARKLALLVGINQYPSRGNAPTTALSGCVTDVELQRELLIYKWGFHPSDILILTDSNATRKNIETAFISHLQQQAKPGDIVLFHFSGYGSRVKGGTTPDLVQNSLVPVDDLFPTSDSPFVNDLLEETLYLMLDSLPTDNAIVILDTSYVYPGGDYQGNLRIRTRIRPRIGVVSPETLAFHTQLKSSDKTGIFAPNKSPIILTAASPSQAASEIQKDGFNAGIFTYALTQTLWSIAPANQWKISFNRVVETVEILTVMEQEPQLLGKEEKTLFGEKISGEGVITEFELKGKSAQFFLGGLPLNISDIYGINSILTLANNPNFGWQIKSKQGLIAQGKLVDLSLDKKQVNFLNLSIQIGDILQEYIRVIPKDIQLMISLDAQFDRIEKVDATSALTGITQVSVVVGEEPADYRFGRLMTTIAQNPSASLASVYQGRYGLFNLGSSAITNTLGEQGEAIKVAVKRVTPQLKSLLAAKLLKSTINETSSRLKVRATLSVLNPDSQVLIERFTMRANNISLPGLTQKNDGKNSPIVSIPMGSRCQYRFFNEGDRPVYCLIFALDSSAEVRFFNPLRDSQKSTDETVTNFSVNNGINPGESFTFPLVNSLNRAENREWRIGARSGLAENLIVFSNAPFLQTLEELEGDITAMKESQNIPILGKPLNVANAVLQDLHNASLKRVETAGIVTDDWALDVNNWATLNFVYRVV
jgi:Caspase domain